MNVRPKSEVRRCTLSNGMTVLYRQDAVFPLASATLLFRHGSRRERRAEAGLCSMTIDLLMQGTRRRNARQIARVMEAVGASLGTQAHEDYTEMGFVAPAAELDKVLGVAAEILHEPSFPQEEVAKEKAHVLADLSSRRDAIFNLAYDHLSKALYGDHPYGRPLEGLENTVKRFSRRDIQAWHERFVRPEQAIFSVIGPMPARQAMRLIEKHMKSWSNRHSPRSLAGNPWIPCQNPQGMTRNLTIRSKFEQAYFMLGFQAPPGTHPDHIPLKVLNTLLGGGMSSRLFLTLREKLGLAYEVSSFYPTRLDPSEWVIYLGLPAEKLHTASRELNCLLDQLASRKPLASELDQAKAMIRGAFLMDRQSRRRQAWYTAWWEFLGRGSEYGQEFLKAIDAVTPKAMYELARRILEQPRVTVTVIPK